MNLKEKVAEALRHSLAPERILLEEDDGIFGYLVSEQFRGMPALERQTAIYRALRHSTSKLTKSELRQVLAIAALTPIEFASIDLPVRPARGDR